MINKIYKTDNEPAGFWRDIPGYEGMYQASIEGNIRKVYKNGRARILSTFTKRNVNNKSRFIDLTKDGHKRQVFVHHAVAAAFGIVAPEGYVIYHKDGCVTNNAVYNLAPITRKQLSSMCGKRQESRLPVLKIDEDGNVLDTYGSITEAAKDSAFCVQAVWNRVYGKVKHPFRTADYTFVLDK